MALRRGSRHPQCTPNVSRWCNHVPLEAVTIESLLHVRREHPTRVACSMEVIEQFPDHASYPEVLWWHDLNRLPHVAVKECRRDVEHHDDHSHVLSCSTVAFRLVTRCPTEDESHEFQRWCRCERVGSHLSGVDICSTVSLAPFGSSVLSQACRRVLVPLWPCSVLRHHQRLPSPASLCMFLCGPRPMQSVQPGDAPYRATILLVKCVR